MCNTLEQFLINARNPLRVYPSIPFYMTKKYKKPVYKSKQSGKVTTSEFHRELAKNWMLIWLYKYSHITLLSVTSLRDGWLSKALKLNPQFLQ